MEDSQTMRESRLVRIDNRDRTADSQTPYDFKVSNNDYLLHNIQRVLLKSVYIPNTAYNVNQYKNVLTYDAGLGEKSITIPVGQYNITQLMDEITSLLAAEAPPVTLTYSFNEITSKLLINTNPATIIFGKEKSSIWEVLGIGEEDLPLSAIHAFPNVVNLSGLQKVFVGSYTLAKGVQLSSSDKQHFKIWTEIPIQVPYGAVQHRVLSQLNSIDESTHSIPFNISYSDITLYDQDLNILDLNGASFQIVLKVFGSDVHM